MSMFPEYSDAFMTQLLIECFLRALECMLTLVIRRGKTALHLAVKYGQPIEALLKIKADVNTKD